VEAHGGRVWADAAPRGARAAFRFTLLYRAPDDAEGTAGRTR
jgi:signal transduction histidine kinase